MRLNELFDAGELDYDKAAARFIAETTLSDGTELTIECRKVRGVWDVLFTVDGGVALTAAGLELEVFSHVIIALREFVTHYKPSALSFTADSSTRVSLYRRFLARYCQHMQLYEYKHGSVAAVMAVDGDLPIQEIKYDSGLRVTFHLFDHIAEITIDLEKVTINYSPIVKKVIEAGGTSALLVNSVIDRAIELSGVDAKALTLL